MKLVKYRDAGMHTYTYFFVNSDDRTISPFFDSEKEADEWMNDQIDQFENWKANKDIT